MRITVLGATGRVGRQVVQQALDAGHAVTAVVRNPERLPIAPHPRLDVATVADVTDPEALFPAMSGCDAVVSALGPAGNKGAKSAPIAGPALRATVEAMGQAGVRRLSALSAAPVGPEAEGEAIFTRKVVLPMLRSLQKDLYADLASMEQAIAEAPVEWTVVRPPMLLNRPYTGTYRRVVGGNVPGARTVSRADVAHALLTCLDEPETVGQGVGVAA
ncbi:SDR family oxidoreductase [Streptomyces oryzae]|uniref:SDR family oxidoreductase n=1 Tax=Streptomyces oryzae TaxID=1434886 RepID=A0ABS3X8B8_9ACTN|nr:SDR family oxidoreductase [Streptomyces oryzae]MBO8191624.1 SDR family oxidoreductase [Streptomyces oryzae]